MDFLSQKAIGLVGRENNAIMLEYDKSIIISTDILKYPDDKEAASITLDETFKTINLVANDIFLQTRDSEREPESIVYGEKLVDLLRWMIEILITHKHPPNASPIPDFFFEAISRSRTMEVDLLNKRITSR